MPSPFYEAKYTRIFPVTLLMAERLDTLITRHGDDFNDNHLAQIIRENTDTDPDEIAINYLAERFTEGPKKKGRTGQIKRHGRTFGAALIDMFRDLPLVDEMIMIWGLQEARRMYCQEDKEDVMRALELYHRELEGRHTLQWEAALYADGGKYKDDNPGEGMTVIDFTQDPDAAQAQLEQAIKAINEAYH